MGGRSWNTDRTKFFQLQKYFQKLTNMPGVFTKIPTKIKYSQTRSNSIIYKYAGKLLTILLENCNGDSRNSKTIATTETGIHCCLPTQHHRTE